jgi:hypothetical protein
MKESAPEPSATTKGSAIQSASGMFRSYRTIGRTPLASADLSQKAAPPKVLP